MFFQTKDRHSKPPSGSSSQYDLGHAVLFLKNPASDVLVYH